LKYRDFGNTGLSVSEIGFGCSRIGGVFGAGKAGTSETTRVLRRALDAGINFFDTADMYSQGESEALVGKAFRKSRDKVIVASKGGYCLPTQRKLIARVKPLVKPVVKALGIKREKLPQSVSGSLSQSFAPEYLISALEASLRRLGTDYLDLYQLHSPPAEVIERGDFIPTLERMKKQGKIRFYGIACDTAEQALLCLKYSGISSLQFPFGLLDQEAHAILLDDAAAKGVGLIARGSFGGGLLKETLTESQLKHKTEKWERILAYRAVAERQGRKILDAALQFTLFPDAVSVTLLGMHSQSHLDSNLAFAAGPGLSDSEFQDYLRA
jgi:aryl-alcohol dehydrogenase-like predicted oxidoreductase